MNLVKLIDNFFNINPVKFHISFLMCYLSLKRDQIENCSLAVFKYVNYKHNLFS